MANSKTSSKATKKPKKPAEKKAAPKKAETKPKKTAAWDEEPAEPAPPIRRELTGFVFLCLAVFVIIGLFNDDGTVINFLCRFIKGMVGWGFFATAPVFLFIAAILFFHHGRPVEGRVVAALLLPMLFSAIVQLTQGGMELGRLDLGMEVGSLFDKGLSLRSGGVLGGLLATLLTRALSIYGAWLLTLLLLVLCLILTLRGGLRGLGESAKAAAQTVMSERAARVRESVTVPELGVEEEKDEPIAPPKPPRAQKPPKKAERRAAAMDIPLGEDEEPFPLKELPPIQDEPPVQRQAPAREAVAPPRPQGEQARVDDEAEAGQGAPQDGGGAGSRHRSASGAGLPRQRGSRSGLPRPQGAPEGRAQARRGERRDRRSPEEKEAQPEGAGR